MTGAIAPRVAWETVDGIVLLDKPAVLARAEQLGIALHGAE